MNPATIVAERFGRPHQPDDPKFRVWCQAYDEWSSRLGDWQRVYIWHAYDPRTGLRSEFVGPGSGRRAMEHLAEAVTLAVQRERQSRMYHDTPRWAAR